MKKTISAILAAVTVFLMVLPLSGCGASMEGYAIVIGSQAYERTSSAARALQSYLTGLTGEFARIISDDSAPEKAIYIGEQAGDVVSEAIQDGFATPMDYVIKVVGDDIVVVGGSTFSTAAAVEKFRSLLRNEELKLRNGYTYEFCFLDHYQLNPLVTDPDSFQPVWADEYEAPDWLFDQKEKMYVVTHKDSGRLSVLAHRCDFVYYPEGTLEGLLSCLMAGVDGIEMDIQLTKDNIPVVRHDEDLTRNTNFSSMAGKDGLPASNLIGDWTYAQLQQLNLTMNDGTVTDYKIPTLYEALLLAGRYDSLLTLDEKGDSVKKPVFGATGTFCKLEDIQAYGRYTDSLDNLVYYYRNWRREGSRDRFMSVEGMSEEYYELIDFWFDCEEDGGLNAVFATWYDKRYKAWGYDHAKETEDLWQMWYDEGVRTMWSNRAVPAIKYVAQTYRAADYSRLSN